MRHRIIPIAALLVGLAVAGAAGAQFRAREALIASWYHRYLHREPDPTGFRDHLQALRGGAPPLVVESEILGSEEYYRHHGATPRGFVLGLFRDVLGRPPTRGEMAYWLDRVHDDSRAGAARRFLEGFQAPG
jgi:hypothetical protein